MTPHPMVVFSFSPIYFHSHSPTSNPLRRLKISGFDYMCRSTNFDRFHSYGDRLLNRKAFFFQFSGLVSEKPSPEFLTLEFLPPILGDLETRPVSPLSLTLYPLAFPSGEKSSSVVFCSREAVRVGEGDRFEVCMRQEKVMEGVIVKEDRQEGKLGCEVEVCMEVEGHVALLEDKPSPLLGKKKQKKRRGFGFHRLEEIPEEREMSVESDGLDYCHGDFHFACGMDGGDLRKEFDLELEIERVRWAVDLGIWVTCLGVGYLISKSPFALRKRRFL